MVTSKKTEKRARPEGGSMNLPQAHRKLRASFPAFPEVEITVGKEFVLRCGSYVGVRYVARVYLIGFQSWVQCPSGMGTAKDRSEALRLAVENTIASWSWLVEVAA